MLELRDIHIRFVINFTPAHSQAFGTFKLEGPHASAVFVRRARTGAPVLFQAVMGSGGVTRHRSFTKSQDASMLPFVIRLNLPPFRGKWECNTGEMEPGQAAAQLLGRNIKTARLLTGASQDDVAKLAGMHVTNYGKIERGTSNPRC